MVEEWFDVLTAELLVRSPFRRSEYFTRFAAGELSREQVWGHISQHYLLVAWFPRIFSGIHTRADDLEVRKDCARHLLVEDLGHFGGRVGGTPDHDELFGPLVSLLPLQMFAYYIAVGRGRNADRPPDRDDMKYIQEIIYTSMLEGWENR